MPGATSRRNEPNHAKRSSKGSQPEEESQLLVEEATGSDASLLLVTSDVPFHTAMATFDDPFMWHNFMAEASCKLGKQGRCHLQKRDSDHRAAHAGVVTPLAPRLQQVSYKLPLGSSFGQKQI